MVPGGIAVGNAKGWLVPVCGDGGGGASGLRMTFPKAWNGLGTTVVLTVRPVSDCTTCAQAGDRLKAPIAKATHILMGG